jgi:hypothetical protein
VTPINYFLPELAKSHPSVVPHLARRNCMLRFATQSFFLSIFLPHSTSNYTTYSLQFENPITPNNSSK